MSDAAGIPQGRRVAVIGSGVAGLTAAYVLNRQDTVTLFEADARLGGHAHTHDVPQAGGPVLGIDTGFIVHNERTYPTLLRLFAELGIETQDSEMSMSVRCDGSGLEYAGARAKGRGILPRPATAAARPLPADARSRSRASTAGPGRCSPSDDAERRRRTDARPCASSCARESSAATSSRTSWTPVVSAVWSCDPDHGAGLPGALPLHVPGPPRHARRLGLTAVAHRHRRLAQLRGQARRHLPDIRLATRSPRCASTPDGVEVTTDGNGAARRPTTPS